MNVAVRSSGPIASRRRRVIFVVRPHRRAIQDRTLPPPVSLPRDFITNNRPSRDRNIGTTFSFAFSSSPNWYFVLASINPSLRRTSSSNQQIFLQHTGVESSSRISISNFPLLPKTNLLLFPFLKLLTHSRLPLLTTSSPIGYPPLLRIITPPSSTSNSFPDTCGSLSSPHGLFTRSLTL